MFSIMFFLWKIQKRKNQVKYNSDEWFEDRRIVDQIWAILSWSTFTTVLDSYFSPFALKSNSHLWSSGILWELQKTKEHLHSTPNKPTFLLQAKHLFLSFCNSRGFSSSILSFFST